MTPVVLMTGCASGIGRHLVQRLVPRHRVLATDVDGPGLEACAASDGWPSDTVKRLVLDVRSPQAWEEALAAALGHFGRVDVLLNVAGYLRPGYTHQVEAAEVDRHFDVNVKGLIHGCRVVGRHFVAQGAGHIVNVGSLASMAPVPGLSLYSSSKHAVRGLTLAISQELKPHGVAVSLVMPDAVQTPMLDLQVDYDEAAMSFSGARALTVEEVARAIVDEVLPRRPLELALPAGRGFISRLATFAPALIIRFSDHFTSQGRARQRALQARKAAALGEPGR